MFFILLGLLYPGEGQTHSKQGHKSAKEGESKINAMKKNDLGQRCSLWGVGQARSNLDRMVRSLPEEAVCEQPPKWGNAASHTQASSKSIPLRDREPGGAEFLMGMCLMCWRSWKWRDTGGRVRDEVRLHGAFLPVHKVRLHRAHLGFSSTSTEQNTTGDLSQGWDLSFVAFFSPCDLHTF